VQRRMAEWLAKAGVKSAASPHWLRHGFATDLLKKNRGSRARSGGALSPQHHEHAGLRARGCRAGQGGDGVIRGAAPHARFPVRRLSARSRP
jgi:hypothetical protein